MLKFVFHPRTVSVLLFLAVFSHATWDWHQPTGLKWFGHFGVTILFIMLLVGCVTILALSAKLADWYREWYNKNF
jgi:hypothetical protein